jgi:hypothetical protein
MKSPSLMITMILASLGLISGCGSGGGGEDSEYVGGEFIEITNVHNRGECSQVTSINCISEFEGDVFREYHTAFIGGCSDQDLGVSVTWQNLKTGDSGSAQAWPEEYGGGWGISSCVARWKVEIPLSLGHHTIKFTATSQIRSVRTVSVNRSVVMYESYWSEPKTIGWANNRNGLGGEGDTEN